jgi:hypothetical protein
MLAPSTLATRDLDPVTRSYIDKLISDLRDYTEAIKEYRRYDEGDHPSQLDAKQKALLGGTDPTFDINVGPLINNAEVDKMETQNVNITPPVLETDNTEQDSVTTEDGSAPEEDLGDVLSTLNQRWLRQSRWDQGQKNWYYAAARDGDSYLIADYNREKERPELHVNWAWDGENGTDVIYLDGDPSIVLYAKKVWTSKIMDTSGNRERRMNIYLEDKILKFVSKASKDDTGNLDTQWTPYIDGTTQPQALPVEFAGKQVVAGVTFWTEDETEFGTPLGIPVFHYAHDASGNAYGRSNYHGLIPVQNAINKSAATYMMALLLDGFPLHVFTGVDDEEGKLIARTPGSGITLSNDAAGATSLQGAALAQIQDGVNFWIRIAGMITRTTLPLLNPTAEISAEGTLQQQAVPSFEKVKGNQVVAGNAIEDACRMLFKLDAINKNESGLTIEQIEDLQFDTQWKDKQVRNETEIINNAVTKVEKLHLPLDEALREVGVSEEIIQKAIQEIEDAKRAKEIGDNATAAQIIMAMNNLGATNGQANGNQNSNGATPDATNGRNQPAGEEQSG